MIELIKGLISKMMGNANPSQEAHSKEIVTGNRQTRVRSKDTSWKRYIAYVFVFLIVYNYVIIPVVLAVFGVWLPPVVLDDVIKMLVLILSGT
jgi:hypothetical protein